MKDMFISHSSENEKNANEICTILEKQGLHCWIAPRDIQVGKDYGSEIIKGIEECKVVLLVLTRASNESQHVLREIERAVNHKKTIIVYEQEEVALSKSLEYFLASTQWFKPKTKDDVKELVDSIRNIKGKKEEQEEPEECKGKTGRKRAWLYGAVAAAVVLLVLACMKLQPHHQTQIAVGDTFTFGSVDLTGADKEELSWIVLEVDEDAGNALCIAENIVAFQSYDGAESGWRGKIDELYYHEDELNEYSDEQLRQFWGSSDWTTSNIRSWLNSNEAIVSYEGMAPTEDTTSLYENGYETRTGFLYTFTQEEQDALVPRSVESTLEDKVFLLSKEEVEKYLINQNISLSAIPTESAVFTEGTGIYQSYCEEGSLTAYWGLRSTGDIPACTIVFAGTGMGKQENFHSDYACSSLMGVRPAIVLPLTYVEELEAEER